ncbi:MAG: RNA polymerase sigma factor [Acidobacteriota bacterium]|nr:RNA polymerase sigma factor [Acidobacteriota bacterium]
MMTRSSGGGHDDLFQTMYNRYYARMLRFFRRVFRVSEDDARELTQDSFVRFYRTMDEYRGEAEWALLETIARNVGYNKVRSLSTIKRGAVRPESLDEWDHAHDPEAEQPTPLDQMIDAERRTRLRTALAELPKGQRQCLQLRLDDMSYEEISRVLRISLDAVRSRIRDAKRSLRDRLGDEGVLPEDES